MNPTEEYINDTSIDVSKLMDALSSFDREVFKLLARITHTQKPIEQTKEIKNIYSLFIPREAIAGSILQIAFMGMKHFPRTGKKSEVVLLLEQNIQVKTGKSYSYPRQYCIGRQIADIPIGLVIFAARNQYNHQDEPVEKLEYYNRIVFETLDFIYGEIGTTGLGFDLYSEKSLTYAFSVLMLLGWTHTVQTPDPLANFKCDVTSILEFSG